jgi:hypothetical protein
MTQTLTPAEKAMKRKRLIPVAYPPGYFTELVYLHNWPPGFKPQSWNRRSEINAENARANHAKSVEDGSGWGNGTIPMPGTPKHKKPGELERNA